MNLYRSFIFDGATPPPEGTAHSAAWVEVGPTYFETLGVRPAEGRPFTRDDEGGAALVALVNRTLARQMAPGEQIVGRSIRSHYDENLPRRVVGVMPDVQFDGFAGREEPLVLVPRAQSRRRSMALLLRMSGDPSGVVTAVRQVMADLDPDVALERLRTLREAHRADLGGVRFLTGLFGAFGVLALALSVSGAFALVSFSVSQRRSEIGIRMAVGASPPAVRGQVIREGLLLAAGGAAAGLVLAYALSRLLSAALVGLAEPDPATFLGGVLLLSASVLAACWVPAQGATRVDPAEALRAE